MLNKKAYMITPIIFIAFLLISVAFSFYVSGMDTKFSKGIMTSASVEKSVNGIYKMQTDQINFVKLMIYNCSEYNCYNSSSQNTGLKNCVSNSLTIRYQQNNWSASDININGTSESYNVTFKLSSFNATNINMTSDRITVTRALSSLLNTTC